MILTSIQSVKSHSFHKFPFSLLIVSYLLFIPDVSCQQHILLFLSVIACVTIFLIVCFACTEAPIWFGSSAPPPSSCVCLYKEHLIIFYICKFHNLFAQFCVLFLLFKYSRTTLGKISLTTERGYAKGTDDGTRYQNAYAVVKCSSA